MADKPVARCTSILLALFHKQKQKQHSRCPCLCHTYKHKNKNTVEMNDNKFFNCKCYDDECQKQKKCSNCGLKLKRIKKQKSRHKVVRLQIEHTGSLNSLVSPNRVQGPSLLCSACEKRRNYSNNSISKQHSGIWSSPIHGEYRKFRTNHMDEVSGSPYARRTFKKKLEFHSRGNSQEDQTRVS